MPTYKMPDFAALVASYAPEAAALTDDESLGDDRAAILIALEADLRATLPLHLTDSPSHDSQIIEQAGELEDEQPGLDDLDEDVIYEDPDRPPRRRRVVPATREVRDDAHVGEDRGPLRKRR